MENRPYGSNLRNSFQQSGVQSPMNSIIDIKTNDLENRAVVKLQRFFRQRSLTQKLIKNYIEMAGLMNCPANTQQIVISTIKKLGGALNYRYN